MRLMRIELFGFKSFADRVSLELSSGLTAIVGPNGCGKSNVMDAVKWTLGEQRPSILRGDEMMDVVFKGNGARGPRNFAEASLVFDNSDGTMPVDFAEVVITRRLYRSGDSEYLINKQSVRLKDIRNLLMDTGLGTSAYSIMEQGRIDAILSANPAERRRIFEEAAGISRYRAQRRESQLKLERTEQNLLRLGDVIDELERRVRSLKNQAGRARSFVAARDRIRRLKALYYNHRWEELGEELSRLSQRTGELQAAEAAARELMETQRAALDAGQQDLGLVRSEEDTAAEATRQAVSAVENLVQRRTVVDERLTELAERRVDLDRRAEELAADLAGRNEEVTAVSARLDAQRTECETHEETGRARRTELLASERGAEEWHMADNQRKASALARLGELTDARNELAGASSREAGLSASRDRVAERTRVLRDEIASHRSKQGELFEGGRDLEASLEAAQRDVDSHRVRRQELAGRIEALDARLVRRREETAAADSRRAALEELVARREGVSAGARTLLETEADGVVGLAVDHLRVPTEIAEAVEAALAATAEAVVVESRSQGLAALAFLHDSQAGRALLAPRDGLVSRSPSSIEDPPGQRLLDLVTITGENQTVEALLAHARLVDGRSDFLACQPDGVTVWVTRDGDLLDERGLLRGGAGREGGLVARQAEADELAGTVAELRVGLEQMAEERKGRMAELVGLEGDLETAQGQVRRVEKERERAREEERQILARHKALERDLEVHEKDLESLGRELADVLTTRRRATEREQELAAQVLADQAGEEAAVGQRRELEAGLAAHRAAEAEAQLHAGKADERREAVLIELRQVQRALAEREQDLRRGVAEVAQVGDRQTELQVEAGQLEGRSQELEQAREQAAAALAAVRERTDALEQRLANGRAEVGLAESAAEVASEAAAAHRLAEQEARIHRTTLREKVLEELEVDLATERLEVPTADAPVADVAEEEVEPQPGEGQSPEGGADSEASADAAAPQSETPEQEATEQEATEQEATEQEAAAELDWDAIEAEIEELRRKMARMGQVNLGAIDELAEVVERLEFLVGQRNDLDAAKLSLTDTIKVLDKESRERFVSTFEEVRGHFRTIFRKLFHGGRADVSMQEDVDVLEAGVDIVAAPPGKDPRSISLLSGGERTLTAVGLLFALFRTRPSPVCLLDEVDAALDETNIDRFCGVLEDFLSESQFVVVTHARRTMSYADTIFGITMQEHGVSRALTLTMDEYEASRKDGGAMADRPKVRRGAGSGRRPSRGVDTPPAGDDEVAAVKAVSGESSAG